MRLACLFVPDFPLAAWLRAQPDLRGRPVAVTAGEGPRARVVAVSAAAAARGVSVGLSAAQGVALGADLVLRPVSVDAERAAQAALCDAAASFSPRVEDAGGGITYLGTEGLEALFASESQLASALAQRATCLGLDAQVGVAGSKVAAYLAARDGGGVTVIPHGEEWSFLAPLPVALLEPGRELAATLHRWGIRTIGELAALPASAVGARLGPEGVALVRRARGEDAHPLIPRPVPLHFEESVELDYGIDGMEPFLFVLRGLLDRLTARLAVRGLVCGDLRLALALAMRARDERTIAVAAPSNDVKSLLTLVRVQLETHPPAATIEAVRVTAIPERLRPAQLDLFRPNGPAPERLAVTLARLTALCGVDRVGAPVVADTHRPDAFAVAPFGGSSHADAATRRRGDASAASRHGAGPSNQESGSDDLATCRIALRAIRPPCLLEVFCNRGQPDFVRLLPVSDLPASDIAVSPRHRVPASFSWGQGLPEEYACTGRVVTVAGPWRVQGDWWNDGHYARDYYDAQLSDGCVYRLFHDLRQDTWFVDGVYD